MVEVTVKFSDADARYNAYQLRRLYGASKRVGLRRLFEGAIREEVARGAQEELEELAQEEETK